MLGCVGLFGVVKAGELDLVLAEKLQTTPLMEKVPVIIYLRDQVDLDMMEVDLRQMIGPDRRVPVDLRYRTIVTALMDIADQTQPAFLQKVRPYEMDGSLSDIQRFWIRNIIVARATPQTIRAIAQWPEVGTIYYDALLERDVPVSTEPGESNPESSEPGLRAINAHRLWQLGYTGAGRLVMNIDTGVNGNNLSFNSRWRGTVPGVLPTWAWFDPETGTTFPTDCDGHGTHTMGTMCGLYTSTSETLGVAPAARWIAAKTICSSPHTSRSIAAFQWAANPDSNINTMDDVPDAISCSWFDPNVSSTQCQPTSGGYGPVIEAVEALGTAVVFSAGNQGPGASTITPPKNRMRTAVDIFAVGAIDGNNPSFPIASFSSRGPSICTGPDSLRIKPEVVAPGVSVRSASGTNGTSVLSGTSMASPHVAGAIALLRQVAPFLTGTELKYILLATATDLGPVGEDNDYGRGIIDLWRAFQNLPLNLGYVSGTITSGGNPLSGVQVDFVDSVQQVAGTSNVSGFYVAAARVDTPYTTARYTLRARKFGYLTYTDTVTIVLNDTVTRNFAMTPLDLVLTKSSITFAATPVPGSRRDSLVARNQRTTSLTLSSLTTTNPDFSVTPTSATIPANDSVKIYVTYTPTQEGSDTGRVIILSNSTYTPRADVILSGTAIGVPRFTASTDSVTRTMEGGTRDSVQFYVRNVGTTSGNFSARAIMYPRTAAGVSGEPVIIPMVVSGGGNMLIDEQAEIARSMQQQPVYEAPKGVPDIPQGGGTPRPLRRGGPDAFGNIFIDSDEPDGPRFDWVDIRGVGTQITTWTGSADDGYATIPLPFSFPFYGGTWTGTLNVCTNGFISRNATSTAFTNVCLPATAVPNDVIYAFWDDLDLRAAGTVHYYHDAAANQFIVQYTNVPRYPGTAGDSLTFQVILRPNGLIVVQYLGMVSATLNSATIGIENATGTVALQVSCNETGYMHNNLAIAFLPPGVTLQPPWLAVAPTSGTLAIGDSIQMTARFNATDSSIYNNPGNYLGRIEVAATNSALAETLRVHARMFVIPPPNARLSVNPDSLNFGNVEIGTSRVDSVLVRNIGGASLTVTGITMSNTNFSASPTSFTLPSLGEQRVRVTFTAPSPGGTHAGTMTFVSNDPQAPQVRLRAVSVGVAHIAVTPDTFHLTLPASGDTTLRTFTIRNPGTDTLRYTIDETGSGSDAPGTVARSMQQQEAYELPKGAVDDRAGGERSPAGRGGPDAFGYVWIDSDEPDGPRFSWVDIRPLGATALIMTDDNNQGPFPLGFNVSFYGTTYNSIRVCSNGFLSFTSTVTTFTNTAIPTTAEPNNALYAFWDDLNPAAVGRQDTIYYYADAANQRFIVQYQNVRRFADPTVSQMTFQVIIHANGNIVYQYLSMVGVTNDATIGIENASGTIALQVVYNQAYMHDSLAILLTRDLFSWMSVDPTSGTIAPGDSQTVRLRIHPGNLTPGTYTGRQRIRGNTPDVRYVGVRLDVITGVESGLAAVPTTYGLEQNYPNPFNPTTTITYALPSESRVQLRVYNMLGQEVATLVDGTQRAAYYTVQWDGRSRSGTAVSSGIYFVRIDAVPTNGGNTFRHVKKMLLVK